MLKEDQVVELISRCEKLCGESLKQVKGNLKKPETRPEAIWELIGIEEFASKAPVAHEPEGASRPDLIVDLNGQNAAVEFTFLTDRYWKNERKRNRIREIIREVFERSNMPIDHIRTHFDGKKTDKGHVQFLPELHEKSAISQHKNLKALLSSIGSHPNIEMTTKLDPYDIEILYEPSKPPSNFGSGGIVEGHTWKIEETDIYRRIREKHRQHKLDIPLFLCIGADDRSTVSSRMGDSTIQNRAVIAALKKYRKVGGISVSRLEWASTGFDIKPELHHAVYVSGYARFPLSDDFWNLIKSLDFNKWQYTFSLPKWENSSMAERSGLGGPLEVQSLECNKVKLWIPAQILLDALKGKTDIFQEFRSAENDFPRAMFRQEWEIVDIEFQKSEIELGLDNLVAVTLSQRENRVFKK